MRPKLIPLWYVLASAALVARLAVNRATYGQWGFSLELLTLSAVVPILQVGAVVLLKKVRALA